MSPDQGFTTNKHYISSIICQFTQTACRYIKLDEVISVLSEINEMIMSMWEFIENQTQHSYIHLKFHCRTLKYCISCYFDEKEIKLQSKRLNVVK